ncbi:translin associated factor X [Megalopta genalis]|uniref:translin associated factor X n=1 Tax=Megalopta genalis TaxID=115081 RepID=UPI00144388AC|nr:translin-associated protein X isoform X1 [Megalopta genalis]XP_033324131.1 translin-associated protein X isoform X2 [Megalopta genalis]XP_033324132.1 translin-associated protein X isoform X2 [Megalopta genalis]
MSHSKGGRKTHQGNKKINIGDKGKEVLKNLDENSLVVQQFRVYAAELDDKHDRYERILKIGRDITIESKRIIYLLHSIDKKSKQESVLNEAKIRLQNVAQNNFKCIALELENEDGYQYLRAYRGSLEEYIEAFTFYHYLNSNNLEDWTELEKMITYTITDRPEVQTINTLVTPHEYILGIADLTGELMRRCINNLTQDTASCYQMCNFVRNMYTGFLSCKILNCKEMNRKLSTLKQSLCKIENVCYTIKVRGSEIPKHILIDVATKNYEENDEGYQAY